MKIFFILLLSISIIHAKSKESCYSVQLTSFVLKENSTYDFEKEDYPRYCELIPFTNINAVRCGCYENYKDVKKEHEDLSYFYPGATIVTTYKYRFKNKTLRQKLKLKRNIEKKVPLTSKPEEKKETVQRVEQKNNTPEQLQEVETVSDDTFNFLEETTVGGHVDLVAQKYFIAPAEKHTENLSATANLDISYAKDNLSIDAKLKAQADYFDFASSRHNERTYLRLDELYGKYDFLDDQVLLGKNIRFWGALEVRNITDGFNPEELRDDPFDMDKLGVWNASYSHYTDTGEISLIVKLYEQEREMSGLPYVYYYFPARVSGLPYVYKDTLVSEEGQTRPSLYLKYSGTTDTQYPVDYAFIVENGYDSQRYYTATPASDGSKITTQENAYLVNKISTYNTLVVGSTLYKLEALYTDVINSNEISDYYHIGLGVEHTLTGVYKDADLGLISEYYNYRTLESGKRNDLELFELFENDLFLGLRYTLNDGNGANVLAGTILDLQYDEQVYYMEYESRLADVVKLNIDYRYISPSPSDLTAFKLMGKHERMSLKLGYYF
jgi:hypothetical protein